MIVYFYSLHIAEPQLKATSVFFMYRVLSASVHDHNFIKFDAVK